MPPRTDFPNLNSRLDVKHIEADLKKGGLLDPNVYDLAVNQKRILVTYNHKHFREFVGKKADAGIIGVSANLPSSQVDKKLTALLTKSTPSALQKKYVALTGEIQN